MWAQILMIGSRALIGDFTLPLKRKALRVSLSKEDQSLIMKLDTGRIYYFSLFYPSKI